MNKEDKMRKLINQLAHEYRKQVNSSMTQEQARKRVIDGMTRNQNK